MQPNRISIRYYVCANGHLRWRLPKRVHSQLLDGDLRLPEFAGQNIDILEVFSDKNNELVEARGTRGHFDEQGKLDTIRRSVNVIGDVMQIGRFKNGVVDLQPRIRLRRRQIEDLWQPNEALKDQVRADLATGRRSKLSAFPS